MKYLIALSLLLTPPLTTIAANSIWAGSCDCEVYIAGEDETGSSSSQALDDVVGSGEDLAGTVVVTNEAEIDGRCSSPNCNNPAGCEIDIKVKVTVISSTVTPVDFAIGSHEIPLSPTGTPGDPYPYVGTSAAIRVEFDECGTQKTRTVIVRNASETYLTNNTFTIHCGQCPDLVPPQ